MKTKLFVSSALLLSLAATGTAALAEGYSADKSRDVFINRALLGEWKPAASSVSNETPNVDKSLALFEKTVHGKSERVTEATHYKPIGTEVATQLFTSQFQKN